MNYTLQSNPKQKRKQYIDLEDQFADRKEEE